MEERRGKAVYGLVEIAEEGEIENGRREGIDRRVELGGEGEVGEGGRERGKGRGGRVRGINEVGEKSGDICERGENCFLGKNCACLLFFWNSVK